MKVTRSYFIPTQTSFELKLPQDAEFLSIGQLGETPELIFMLDTTKPEQTRKFISSMIGRPIDIKVTYLGKYQSRNKYHLIFEVL